MGAELAKGRKQSTAHRAKAKSAAHRSREAKADIRESAADADADADGNYADADPDCEIDEEAIIDRAAAMFERLSKRYPRQALIAIAQRVLAALGVEPSELYH